MCGSNLTLQFFLLPFLKFLNRSSFCSLCCQNIVRHQQNTKNTKFPIVLSYATFPKIVPQIPTSRCIIDSMNFKNAVEKVEEGDK